jgi:hypothetical protein
VDADRVDPRREITSRPVRPFLLAAVALAALLAILFALWPRHVSLALARVVKPNADLDTIPAVDWEVSPGDRYVALGDAVQIRVIAGARSLTEPELEMIDATGYESSRKGEPAPESDNRASASWELPAVMGDFQYRLRSGRVMTRYHQIHAVPRPKFESVEVRCDFPEYTGLKPQTAKELPPSIEAVAGTRVTLTGVLNVPVAKGRLVRGDQSLADASVSPPADKPPTCTWTLTLTPESTGPASLTMEEEHGIASEPVSLEFKVLADNPPAIKIVQPSESRIKARPEDRLVFKYEASDDYGLSQIEMLLKLDAGEPASVVQPLPEDAPRPLLAVKGDAVLELKRLDLSQVREVTVRMQAADTLPESMKGPQRTASEPVVIEIEHPPESPLAQPDPSQMTPQMAAAEEARKEAEQLAQMADRQEQLAQQAEKAEAEQKDAPQNQQPEWQKAEEQVAEQLAQDVKQDPEAMRAELQAGQAQAKEMAAQAKELSQDQQWLKQEAQQAANPQADREQLKREILDRLAQEQRQVAEQTAQLQQQTQASNPQAAEQMAEAQKEMQQAAQEMGQHQEKPAAENAQKAEEQLRQAEQQLSQAQQSNPASPEQDQRREEAQQLAQSQETIAEALKAVEEGALEKALERMQQGVQQQSEQLHAEAQEMANRAEAVAMDPQSREDSYAAAQQLNDASQHAAEADRAMQQSPQSAAQAQEQTAQSLDHAAESLAKLGEDFAKQAESLQPANPQEMPEGQALASAMENALEAAHSDNRQEAAEAARDAANALKQAAADAAQRAAQASQQASAQNKPQNQQQNQPNKSPATTPGNDNRGKLPPSVAAAPGSKVKPVAVNKGETDSIKFKGKLKGEAQDSAGQDDSDEYRDLINRYFEELSRQGGMPKGK